MPVTYNTRFYFVFMTDAGREMRINIKQAGFSGTATQRPMGATPVLKRDSGGNGIYGTSLEITAECNTDNEFAVLYTSDAKEFLVELVDEDADETLWTGFVSPELYSAPEIAPPYDVRIVAVDGLGELKRDNFAAAGRQSLYTHLSTILSHSGLGAAQSDIVIVDTLACTTPSVSAGNVLTGISVDLDYMADEGSTCYEVLEAILETLNLTITRHANKWLLMRPSDVEVSGGAVAAHTAAGTSVSLPAVTYGSMSVTDWWPVGEMATEIQPARNRISVALPYRPSVSMFNDGNLVDPTAWTSWQVTWKEINGVGGEKRPWITQSAGYVSQTIAVQWFDGALPLRVLLASPQDADHEVAVSIVVELQGSSHTYYLSQRNANYLRWNTDRTNIDITLPPLSGYAYPIVPLDKFSLFEYIIDGIPESGQLSIQISAHYQTGIGDPPVVVGLVSMLQQTVYGYKDDIVIDNGARGAGDDAVMAFGDAPYAQNAVRAIRNVTSASGNVTSEWETARFEGGLLEVVAMERALDVALPRQLTKGTLNVPFGAALPAVIVNPDGLAMQIERYSWRLVDDEVQVELLSVPSGNVEIESDSVTPMTEQEAARATGTAPASGGGGTSPVPGGGGDQFFEAVNDPTTQEIVGAKALYDLHIIQTAADPEADPPVAEVTKNVTDILKHLALQVINPGTANERTVLVVDIDFASMLGVTAGGIGTGGGGGDSGTIAGLDDVELSALANRQVLIYDGATSHWINVTPVLNTLADVDIIGSPSVGQILVFGPNGKWTAAEVPDSSVGIENVTTPQDGTLVFHFRNGNTVIANLNHEHEEYCSKVAETAQPSGGFLPDVVYKLGTLTGTVTFSIAPEVSGNINHYYWTFSTGSTPPTVTWPDGITWAGSGAPTIAASKHYEISIQDGIAIYLEA